MPTCSRCKNCLKTAQEQKKIGLWESDLTKSIWPTRAFQCTWILPGKNAKGVAFNFGKNICTVSVPELLQHQDKWLAKPNSPLMILGLSPISSSVKGRICVVVVEVCIWFSGCSGGCDLQVLMAEVCRLPVFGSSWDAAAFEENLFEETPFIGNSPVTEVARPFEEAGQPGCSWKEVLESGLGWEWLQLVRSW